jgi:cytochrome P450
MPVAGWLGNAIQFYQDPITYMSKVKAAYDSDVIAFVQGGNKSLLYTEPKAPGTVFIFGPTYNQMILSNASTFEARLPAGPDTPAFRRLNQKSVIFVNGEDHKQYRRLMMPAFHKKRIELYRDDMAAITQKMLDSWTPGDEPKDMLKEMQRLTLVIANKTLFGLDVSEQAGSLGELIQAWFKLLVSPAAIVRLDVPGMPFHQLKVLSEQVDKAVTALVTRRRAAGTDAGDVLSTLIQARDEDGNSLSEDEIVSNATTLFIAGHETTANALSWTLLLLAQHPQVMRDLYDELDGTLHGDAPRVEQVENLKLLDAVIKESLRLLPPGAISIRIANESVDIGPYQIPQWSEIIFSRYHIHHAPELYPEPNRFRPERWFEINPTTYEYLPFGAGVRMCIGSTFASFEMKIILAMLLQRYRLSTVAGSKINRNVGFTMAPKPGMPMVVHRQDRAFDRSQTPVKGIIREMVDLA